MTGDLAALVTGKQRQTVWICRHSIVPWAGLCAASYGWGSYVGLEGALCIIWVGGGGLCWGVLPMVRQCPVPKALVLQLGENNLGKHSGMELVHHAETDLGLLQQQLPTRALVWLDWLERRSWWGAISPPKIYVAQCKGLASDRGALLTGGDLPFFLGYGHGATRGLCYLAGLATAVAVLAGSGG